MKFSIVTPCYNSERYLEMCIKSIMSQTYSDFEHIIVDGGSTDGTLDIIKKYEGKYNMKWISEKDEGMYDAINKGFKMASGEVYSWINADDSYLPWTLTAVANALKDNKHIKWITGIPASFDDNYRLFLPSGYNFVTYNRKSIEKGQHHGRGKGFIQQESTFWRTELWNQVGGLDTNFKYAGDFDLWRRFAQFETLYTLDTIIAGFHPHEGQKSEDFIAYYNELSKYCTWRNFIWWTLNKIFKINKIYYFANKNKLIKSSRLRITAQQRMSDLKRYINIFLLRKK